MSKIFRMDEVLEFAIQKERNSIFFYSQLASVSMSGEINDTLLNLVEQEKEHEAFFTKMKNDYAKNKLALPEQSEDFKRYMLELIATSHRAQLPTEFSGLKEVLDYAIDREKDSVLFYSGLRQFVSSSDTEELQHVIDEEVRHVVWLARLRNPVKL